MQHVLYKAENNWTPLLFFDIDDDNFTIIAEF